MDSSLKMSGDASLTVGLVVDGSGDVVSVTNEVVDVSDMVVLRSLESYIKSSVVSDL